MDSELLNAPEADLLVECASRALNLKSDTSSSEEASVAAMVSKQNRAAPLASKNTSVWEFRPALDATQVLPGHSLHFISTMFGKYFLYDVCWHLSSNMSSPV